MSRDDLIGLIRAKNDELRSLQDQVQLFKAKEIKSVYFPEIDGSTSEPFMMNRLLRIRYNEIILLGKRLSLT